MWGIFSVFHKLFPVKIISLANYFIDIYVYKGGKDIENNTGTLFTFKYLIESLKSLCFFHFIKQEKLSRILVKGMSL